MKQYREQFGCHNCAHLFRGNEEVRVMDDEYYCALDGEPTKEAFDEWGVRYSVAPFGICLDWEYVLGELI